MKKLFSHVSKSTNEAMLNRSHAGYKGTNRKSAQHRAIMKVMSEEKRSSNIAKNTSRHGYRDEIYKARTKALRSK